MTRSPGSASSVPGGGRVRGEWRWWSVLLLLALMWAAFWALGSVGARQAARGERVLGELDPVVQWLRVAGLQTSLWLLGHGNEVGAAITGVAAAIALAGLVAGGMRALPLVLLAATVSLCGWGQILLLANQPYRGAWMHGLGVLCAVALGAVCPLGSLKGIAQLPSQAGGAGPAPTPPWRPHWAWEGLLVLLLTLAGVLGRLYGLTELPHNFETEMIDSMIMSRTTWSVAKYFHHFFMSNSAGIAHMLPGPLFFELFGSSMYTVRLISVFLGSAAVPLAYWLVRRMVGFGGAVAATLLILSAPEQLYWSRLETGGFGPVALLALLAVHVGLWVVQRFSLGALVGAALLTPLSRYFYAPAYGLFVYPLLVYLHGVVFVRRAWRTLWYGLPLLAGGVLLWIYSLTLVFSYLIEGRWRFIHPLYIFGGPVWRRYNQPRFRDADPLELIRLQAVTMTDRLGEVIAGLWYHGPGMFSHWFGRICPAVDNLTILNAFVAAAFLLGLGYLLGQVQRRRAFLLLLWIALGVQPAILSEEPSTRRLSLMLPGVCVVVGVMASAGVAIVRTFAGRWLARLTAALLGVVWAAVVCANFSSHFLLRMGTSFFGPVIPFSKPIFEESDLILYDLELVPTRSNTIIKMMMLGNLDSFLAAPPCLRSVKSKDWLAAALALSCDFSDHVFDITLPQWRRESLARAFNPRRASLVLEDAEETREYVGLLQEMYPGATVRRVDFAEGHRALVSFTIDVSDARALASPELHAGAGAVLPDGLEKRLLDGVTLARADSTAADAPVGVRGGLLLERDGWYDFALGSECPGATLSVGGRGFPAAALQPLIAGVYPFDLTVPDPAACSLPLTVSMRSEQNAQAVRVPSALFVSPKLVAVSRTGSVAPYDGYGAARAVARWPGRALDAAVDAQGSVSVLIVMQTAGAEGWSVRRFDREGREEAVWKLDASMNTPVLGLEIARDGTVVVMADMNILLYDHSGQQVGSWKTATRPLDLALAPDGRILLAQPFRHSIGVYERDGTPVGQITEFAGSTAKLSGPGAVAIGPEGRLLVVQRDGRAFVARIDGDILHPVLLHEFQVDFASDPVEARGCSFDGPDRLLIPDPATRKTMVYSVSGRRLMAAAPERDLTTRQFGGIVQFRSAVERLLAADDSRLWVLER